VVTLGRFSFCLRQYRFMKESAIETCAPPPTERQYRKYCPIRLKPPNFGSLYSFIERNSEPTKAGFGFKLVEQFCAIHGLDSDLLKELCFYFGASEDKEVLVKVKGNVLAKAMLREWGYRVNKMARS
jgi:hypothetical protein